MLRAFLIRWREMTCRHVRATEHAEPYVGQQNIRSIIASLLQSMEFFKFSLKSSIYIYTYQHHYDQGRRASTQNQTPWHAIYPLAIEQFAMEIAPFIDCLHWFIVSTTTMVINKKQSFSNLFHSYNGTYAIWWTFIDDEHDYNDYMLHSFSIVMIEHL